MPGACLTTAKLSLDLTIRTFSKKRKHPQMKKILLLLFISVTLGLQAQESNLYHIADTAFVSWLQERYPQVLVNDSLDASATAGITTLSFGKRSYYSSGETYIKNLDGLQHFTELDSLNISYFHLISLPELPQSLTKLRIVNTLVNSLPQLPVGLTRLECSRNILLSLPQLPQSLTYLDCEYNDITALPELPYSLTYLQCGGNDLTVLPELPSGLTTLECRYNDLTVLPELPSGLTSLNCRDNDLTVLPELPSGLTTLDCYNNDLTALPELPTGLTTLDCRFNDLTVLPELPSGLTSLDCRWNDLTVLPELPSGLTSLSCGANDLTVLPELPSGLTTLDCRYNDLTVLPSLPTNLEYLYLSSDSLTCVNFVPLQYSTFQVNGMALRDYPTCDSTTCYNTVGDTIECVEEVIVDSLGCTNPTASNYNPSANINDGNCMIHGCTDSLAINYNSLANLENTSCMYGFSHNLGQNIQLDSMTSSLDTMNKYNIYMDSLSQSLSSALDSSNRSILALEEVVGKWDISTELVEDWNFFGYGCPEPRDLEVVLSQYIDYIIIAKDYLGKAYLPEWNFNGIGDLVPGLGYQIKLTQAIADFSVCDVFAIDVSKGNIDALYEDLSSLQSQLDSLSTSSADTVRSLEQQMGLLQSKLDTLSASNADTIISLEQQMGLLNLQIDSLSDLNTDTVLSLEQQMDLLQSQLDTLSASNTDTIISLEQQMALLQSELDYIYETDVSDIISLMQENTSLKAELDSLYGCVDANACNYDLQAVLDDGECQYPDSGYDCQGICVDELACNYGLNQSQCEFPAPGYNCFGNEVLAQIGDTLYGGIVFYIDSTGQHGLVAALNDLEQEYQWGCYQEYVEGADGTAIGTGLQNTLDIVNSNCLLVDRTSELIDGSYVYTFSAPYEGQTAAGAAYEYESGGFDDWYLPSKDELYEMYSTIGQGGPEGNIGGFNYWSYWSSSEGTSNFAWGFSFLLGLNGYEYKSTASGVRFIRSF